MQRITMLLCLLFVVHCSDEVQPDGGVGDGDVAEVGPSDSDVPDSDLFDGDRDSDRDGDAPPDDVVATLDVEGSRLDYRESGRFDIVDDAGRVIVSRAVGVVMLNAADDSGVRLSTDSQWERSFESIQDITDPLGEARRLVITISGEAGEPDLLWTLSAYQEGGFYTFHIAIENSSGQTVDVAKTSAIQTTSDHGGAIFLGQDPPRHRILENGSLTYLDFVAEVVPGDVDENVLASIVPGSFEGHSASNWNHAVMDLDGEDSWVAGALTFERSLPVFNLSFEQRDALQAPDGRTGFTYFSAESAYLPTPRPVEDGARLASEVIYVHPTESDAGAGLERYAERIALHQGLSLWTHRGHRVPNGWNSWSGSGSTGGYGTDINEDVILENLDIMATEFRDWGMDWFQIDDGYEPYYGDWWWREDRFPNGPAWLADQIRARGLRPGLWMAPFTPSASSQLAADHPDWIADWTPLFQGSDDLILDLTHPEVHEYIRELFDRFRNEWGFEWFKMDFAYYALFGEGFYDPSMTREEAWRQALGIIREEIGDDTFFVLVGSIGINFGIVDGGRTTMDSMPLWDWEEGADSHVAQQGLKPTVRSAGRRWYLQNRVWINHPDLIFLRSNTLDESWPRLTLEESQAFCSFIGLSGGIVKIGDRLIDLEAEGINSIRALLPTYGEAARPLDVFTREFPEIWYLPVNSPLDGYDEAFELLGLYNWGLNTDMSTNPYTTIPDDGEPIELDVDLGALGIDGERLAYEFWNQEFLGVVSGTLTENVPAHSSRVIALRPRTGAPQFLGWNRQITMGGSVLEEARWDEARGQLRLRFRAAAPTPTAPFTYELALYVPDGFEYSGMTSSGVELDALETFLETNVLRVRFVPQETGDAEIVLSF